MLRSNRILTLDVGASKIVLAEFAVGRSGPPQLTRYGIGHLDIDPENDSHSSAILVATLRELLREHAIKPGPMYMSISGQAVFPRFVKLPPVGKDKLFQIVRYEAEQNVPFPINEVVWDYQLLSGGGAVDADTNVMLVAVKVDNVTRLTDCVQAAHLEPRVVDAAPMALYNAVAFNQPDPEGCTMLLDIGARSSNLIMFEEHRVFTRSVPVAGNAITQEIAKQFGIEFAEAEQLKRQHAQVDLGGNTEGPADETGQQIAKIVRTVLTRLHAEVNRSVNFYRSQQGGSPPSRMYLTGGSSIMPYTDVFFQDKLGVDVEYLNPFVRIPVAGTIAEDRIAGDVHLLGESVGLALRHTTTCAVEINLMPPDLVALKTFRKRQPFFAVAAAAVLLVLLAFWGLSRHSLAVADSELTSVNKRIGELQAVQGRLDGELEAKATAQAKVDAIGDLVDRRSQWVDVMASLHEALMDGMWLTEMTPEVRGDGTAVRMRIKGRGFEDKLRVLESRDSTVIEVFRNRLRATSAFTDETEIESSPPPGPGAFYREFSLLVVFAKPLNVR